MPVKIQTGDNSSDPRVISLAAYELGCANFSLHYYYTDTAASFNGSEIQIPWLDLQNAVDSYVIESGTPENEVALRFVHCFDPIAESLYYRLQICKMVLSSTPPPAGASAVYDLVTTGARWYEIKQNQFGSTLNHALAGAEYLNNFYYKDEPQASTMEKLAEGPALFVKNFTLPWTQELKLIYTENGSPVGAGINFASCSYIEPPAYANVEWPHGMVAYLTNASGQPFLDNEDYVHIFHNKGADYSTLCPPQCNVYIAPAI